MNYKMPTINERMKPQPVQTACSQFLTYLPQDCMKIHSKYSTPSGSLGKGGDCGSNPKTNRFFRPIQLPTNSPHKLSLQDHAAHGQWPIGLGSWIQKTRSRRAQIGSQHMGRRLSRFIQLFTAFDDTLKLFLSEISTDLINFEHYNYKKKWQINIIVRRALATLSSLRLNVSSCYHTKESWSIKLNRLQNPSFRWDDTAQFLLIHPHLGSVCFDSFNSMISQLCRLRSCPILKPQSYAVWGSFYIKLFNLKITQSHRVALWFE